jgi:hypothetical protein
VKSRLRLDVAKLRAHGTRASRAAAALAALEPRGTQDVIDALLDVERTGAKRLHRAGGQARLRRTGAARAGGRRQARQPDAIGEYQCAAVGVPEPPAGMDEQADRTSVHGFASGREPLKGRRGRGSAWIEGCRGELRRQRADDASRPAIERIRQPIARLDGPQESLPLHTAGKAEEDERSDTHRRQENLEFSGLGVQGTANGEAERLCAPAKRIEVDAGTRVRRCAHKHAS